MSQINKGDKWELLEDYDIIEVPNPNMCCGGTVAIIHFPCTPFGHSLLPTLIALSFNCPHVFEKILNTHVFEMYGCSESGAIATRQINKGDKWELLEDYDIKANNFALTNS
jgi:hypothetical protein